MSLLFLCLFLCSFAQEETEEELSLIEKDTSIELLYPQEVIFFPEGGFFSNTIEVELSSLEKTDKIYYTTDGSEPNRNSNLYRKKIPLDTTTVIRAIIIKKNGDKSRIEASTYFMNEPETDWAVVSLSVKPEMLFDSIDGLFQVGVHNEVEGIGNYGANYWDRKEHFMNAEIFESDSSCIYRSPCGFRLFGGMSRTFPQKSILLISRLRYGNKRIRHQIFPEEKLNKFKFLILRNAGSDWGKSHSRDVVINTIVEDWKIDKQAHRPCHVYVNGKYWGVYYFREKINSYFIASHHKKVNPDTLDLIEHRWALRKGSKKSYLNLLQFLEKEDISLEKNYNYLKTLIDIENYADYKLLQIFIDNVDAGGNIKFWRSDIHNGGRWQWILYDTDWGFGLMKPKAYEENSLDFHTEEEGPDWPNPPWSTLILRKLLDNEEFKYLFINRFCDHLNTTFLRDSMLAKIEEHYQLILPEMPRQWERWGLSKRVWNIHFNRIKNFAKKRPDIIWKQIAEKYETGKKIKINVEAEGRGRVMINEHVKASYVKSFSGFYFENIPITLRAIPRLGYSFSHWEGTDKTSPFLKVYLNDKNNSKYYKAIFIPITTPLQDSIFFNEISCYNQKSGDWLEIHNSTNSNINLGGWIIKNKKNEFILPSFWLGPKDYVVVAKDTLNFMQTYPMYKYKIIGDFDFGLDKQTDKLELYTNQGATVDTFSYFISTPQSAFTIDLKDPRLDNGNRENWEVKYGLGSPNAHNPTYMSALAYKKQVKWFLVGIICGVVLIFFIGYSAYTYR